MGCCFRGLPRSRNYSAPVWCRGELNTMKLNSTSKQTHASHTSHSCTQANEVSTLEAFRRQFSGVSFSKVRLGNKQDDMILQDSQFFLSGSNPSFQVVHVLMALEFRGDTGGEVVTKWAIHLSRKGLMLNKWRGACQKGTYKMRAKHQQNDDRFEVCRKALVSIPCMVICSKRDEGACSRAKKSYQKGVDLFTALRWSLPLISMT
jgi:hypothetical protein